MHDKTINRVEMTSQLRQIAGAIVSKRQTSIFTTYLGLQKSSAASVSGLAKQEVFKVKKYLTSTKRQEFAMGSLERQYAANRGAKRHRRSSDG